MALVKLLVFVALGVCALLAVGALSGHFPGLANEAFKVSQKPISFGTCLLGCAVVFDGWVVTKIKK